MVLGLFLEKNMKSGGKSSKNNIKWGQKGVLPPKLLKKTKKVDIFGQMCYSLAKLVVFDTPGQVIKWNVNKAANI